MEVTLEMKVAFLGESGVGKTTIIQSFHNVDITNQTPTLGASFSMHYVNIDNDIIRLKIWDTAGQEKFKSLAPLYFRDSQIIVLVYSVTDPDSFKALETWYSYIESNLSVIPKLFVVGNKVDLERRVDENISHVYADSINAIYYEVSAKMHLGVQDLLTLLAAQGQSFYTATATYTDISQTNTNDKKKKCC